MDTTGGYQSLLGLTSINSNSSTIDVLEVENININGVIDLSQAIVGGLTTSQVDEGLNLYYTDTRVNNNSNVSSNTTHRDRTDNPHAVTATQVGIDDTDDISEGVTNLYYTDIRFDDRLATKTTTSLAEGSNLYYTDARFDTRLATKTTTDLTEGTNLYYTDARFDARLGTKTTTDLTEGTNLYYTTTRANADFDTRLATKTTTNLTEGANLYYTDARFDARLATKTTTNLTEGANLYYTEARVSANTDVKANSDYRNIGHLPLSGGTLSGNLNMGNQDIDNVNQVFIDRKGLANNKLVLWDNGTPSTTDFYGFGIQNYTLMYNTYASTDNHKFYYGGTNELFRIGHAGVFSYRNLDITGNITLSGTVDGVDLAALNTAANNHIANTNNPHAVLATQITDFDTEVSANTNVSANTAKVSADGSINTHSDVSILDVQDQQFLKYSSFTQKWANVTPTTAMIAEQNNLYYTDARFDTRFATKTTTNLTEGTNLYYTEARFDSSFGVKKTTDLTEGINLYYTDARFDTRFGIKTTTNLTEGSNLYYTEARVSANTDVKANSDYRAVGHLPLSGGIMTGDIIWDTDIEIPTWVSDTVYTPSDDPNWSISSSSIYSSDYRTYEAFNKTVDGNGTNCWISAAGRYNTNGTVNASTYTTTQVDGSNSYQGEWIQVQHTEKKLRLTSFILTARSKYTEYSKYYRLLGTNDDPTGSPNWTTLMYNTTQLVWGSPGASLVLTPDGVLGYYNTYRLLITQTSLAYCSIARFIPSFVTEGNTISNVFSINGTPVDTLIADVSANTAKVSYPSADSTKVGFISVTQAVNLDTMESDIATNNNKVSYPSADSTKVGFISVTQAVNLDTMESDIATNNNKVSYPSADSTKVGFISVTQAVNLDTMESDITSNNAYRNVGHLPLAGGTLTGDIIWDTDIEIPTWSSNTVYTPSDDPNWSISSSSFLIEGLENVYFAFKAFNKTVNDVNDCWVSDFAKYNSNGTVNASTYTTTQVDGSNSYQGEWIQIRNTDKKLRLTSFILTARDNTEYSKYYRLLGTNDDPTGSPNWTTLMYNTTQLVWSGPGASLVLTPETKLGYYNTYRLLITQCTTLYCSIARFIPSFVTEGTIIDGTSINGTDIDTLIADVKTNTAKVSADGSINTHSDVNITTPADGHVLTYDTGEWKNLAPAEVTGYLPLDGSTAMTGALNIDPSNHGEKVIFYETTPTEVPYGIQTSNGYIMHGVEYNGSHVFIYDIDGKLATAGYTLQLNRLGSIMNTELSMNNHKITDLTTPTDTADATTKGYVDTAVNAKLSVNGTSIMIGNLNMGNYDIDNVNQVFINRSGLANNKLVLYDAGNGSTTDFYGFGIQSATLMYNVNSTGANHKFYYAGVYELFRIGHSGIYSYRNLDVTGNITVSGTVDGIDIQSLNTTVDGKLSLAGGGVITNGSINIYTQTRSGSHGTVKGLYVTSDFGQYSSGAEFRHSNGTQGVGIGYAGIYACGSNGSQNLTIAPKGTTGDCYVISSGGSSLKLGKRSAVTGEPMISLRRNGDSGEACLGYGGSLYAWVTTNQGNTPVGGYTYLTSASGVWVNASDRRLKCDIVDLEIKDCCSKICLLKPRNYRWKRDEKKNNNIGFIADEVKEVYPELVSNSGMTIEGDENIEGINYTGMIPILVGAIQSMMCKINELRAEVELLKNPVI